MSAATASSAKRSLVKGSSALRKCLLEQRSSLQHSPLVVVSSQIGSSSEAADAIPAVQQACDFASYVTSQELGLRTVPVGLESAFPTAMDVERGMDLMQRTGAGAVLGVGSGAAMDLAKALSRSGGSSKLVLAPSTLGATLAAGSSQSLLLDTHEETVIPYESNLSSGDIELLETVVALDEKTINAGSNHTGVSPTLSQAAYASLAIVFDTMYSNGAVANEETSAALSLKSSLNALNTTSNGAAPHVVHSLYQAGLSLQYGIPASSTNFKRRSIPLALACSILPVSFPQSHVLTFMASLLPGLHETLVSRAPTSITDENVNVLLKQVTQWLDSAPSLSRLSVDSSTAHTVHTLMKQVQDNQALWNCHDAQDDILEEVLHRSLNR